MHNFLTDLYFLLRDANAYYALINPTLNSQYQLLKKKQKKAPTLNIYIIQGITL